MAPTRKSQGKAPCRAMTRKEDKMMLDGILKFHSIYGEEKTRNWTLILQLSRLTGFTSTQLRQRYLNLQKRGKPDTVIPCEVNTSTPDMDEHFPSEGSTNQRSAIVNMVSRAMKIVHPWTALGEGFFDRLKVLYKDEIPDLDFKSLQRYISDAIPLMSADWIAKLRHVKETYTPAYCNQKRLIADLKRLDKELGARNVAVRQAVVNTREPDAACAQLPSPTTKGNVQDMAPVVVTAADAGVNKRKTDGGKQSRFDRVGIWHHSDMALRLPIPEGYGAQHVLRVLHDNEWRRIIEYSIIHHLNLEMATGEDWRLMLDRAMIQTSKEATRVKLDFFRYAVPRIVMLSEYVGHRLEIYMENTNTFSCTAIFHSMKTVSIEGLGTSIKDLVENKILSTEKMPVGQWKHAFVQCILTENCDYFHVCQEEFSDAKSIFLEALMSSIGG